MVAEANSLSSWRSICPPPSTIREANLRAEIARLQAFAQQASHVQRQLVVMQRRYNTALALIGAFVRAVLFVCPFCVLIAR